MNIFASSLSVLNVIVVVSVSKIIKDLKEVYGLGRQEFRKWSSCKVCVAIAALNFTAVKIWTWDQDRSELTESRPLLEPRIYGRRVKTKGIRLRKIGIEKILRNICKDKPDEFRYVIIRLASYRSTKRKKSNILSKLLKQNDRLRLKEQTTAV